MQSNKLFTFTKDERLKSKKQIDLLFAKSSKSCYVYPIRLVYTKHAKGINQAAFSVSKKKLKLAVHRNRVKRQMREAYRLQKHELVDLPSPLAMMWIFVDDKLVPYHAIKESIKKIITRIKESNDSDFS